MLNGAPQEESEGTPLPRMAVIRSMRDMKHLAALLTATRSVLVVVRTPDDDRRRVRDFLAGWAVGSGGTVDEISSSVSVVQPLGSSPLRLSRSEFVSTIDSVLQTGNGPGVTADQERELYDSAAKGSLTARRRLGDYYSEVATVLGLALRPPHVDQADAVRIAHDELDRLVSWPPSRDHMLVALTNAINERFTTAGH
jgi:hypothetical protein